MNVTRDGQSTDSLNRNTRPTPTNGRTDGLTKSLLPSVEILGFRNARAHMPEYVIDGEPQRLNLEATLAELRSEVAVRDERMPVVRDRTQRVELPKILRILVLRRDNFTCQWCGVDAKTFPEQLFEVDHIVPWSAGGADASWNLRTLCRECNQERSNRATDHKRASVLPIVTHCPRCEERQARYQAWIWNDEPEFVERDTATDVAAWCGRCGCGTTAPAEMVRDDPANRLVAGQPNPGCRSEAIARPDEDDQ